MVGSRRDPNYKDEVQVFNNDPVRFVEERYKGRQRREETHHPYDASSLLPSHVVMFSDDGGQLDPLLTSLSYKEVLSSMLYHLTIYTNNFLSSFPLFFSILFLYV